MDPTAEEVEATGTTATADVTTTTRIATTGDGTDPDRETGIETQGDRAGTETADAIAPDPATGPLAVHGAVVTEAAAATVTTTIRDAQGTMKAGAQEGATALPSIETVSYSLTYYDYSKSPMKPTADIMVSYRLPPQIRVPRPQRKPRYSRPPHQNQNRHQPTQRTALGIHQSRRQGWRCRPRPWARQGGRLP